MSDRQKRALTLGFILSVAILLCVGIVAGAVFIFGEVTELTDSSAPTSAPTDGVLITAVLPESPAARANLQPGHVLLRLDDDPITSPELLTLLLKNLPVDAEFTLLVRDDAGTIWQTTAVRAAEPPYLGVEIVDFPLQTPEPTSINPSSTSIAPTVIALPVITGIVPDSPAAAVDIQVGDIVTAVDGAAILNGEELLNLMAAKVPGESVTLTLRREEDTLQRTAVLAPHPDDAQRGFLGIEFQP